MAEIKDPENTIIIELKDGRVVIELLPAVAPKHAERMKTLARAGAYDNVVFHRVIDGFMAQTGDVEHGKAGRRSACAAQGPADRTFPTFLPSFPSFRMTGVRSGLPARPTRIRPTASSSSISVTTIS